MTGTYYKWTALPAAAVVLAGCLTLAGAVQAQEKHITFVGFGGETDEALKMTVFKEFQQKTGIRIIQDTWSGKEFAMVRAQVEQKNVQWDILFADPDRVIQGCEQGFLMPIPKDKYGPIDDYLPDTVHECGVPFDVAAYIIAYDANRLPPAWGGKVPTTFMDFWDVQKFPGRRGLRNRIKVTAEQALMADGVPNEKVYDVLRAPGGIERALAKLQSIRPLSLFWSRNPQQAQLLADGEVVMTIADSARIMAHNQQGRKFQVIWDRTIWSSNMLIIPKGPRAREALMLLEFMQRPEIMAKPANYVPRGPARKSALKFVDPKSRSLLTTAPENLATALRRDEKFWMDHEAEFEKKFSVWHSK